MGVAVGNMIEPFVNKEFHMKQEVDKNYFIMLIIKREIAELKLHFFSIKKWW